MIEPPRADSEELDPTTVHRRAFLASCGVLAAALSGCSYVFPRTRLGRLAVNDPHPEVYRPVLRALLSTILPFDHPDFPSVSLDEIEERLLRLFPVERQDDYAAMQRALVFFDAVDLFPQMHVPLVADERNFFGASRAEVESYVAEDRRGYDSFVNEFVRVAIRDGCIIVFEKDLRRNYVHVRDVAECIIHCIDNASAMTGTAYNVCLNCINYSKGEVADYIKVFVPKFYIHHAVIDSAFNKTNYNVSSKKLAAAGYTAHRSLDQGIPELIKGLSMIRL